MIKLIASDLDGTLINSGRRQVSREMFILIEKMLKRGIYFCAASGRQYNSLLTLFAPVKDDILYMCENGAVVFYKGTVIAKTALPRDTAEAITAEVLAIGDCEVLISGERTSYLIPKHEDYADHIRNFVGNHVTVVSDIGKVREDILKVSAYCRSGALACQPLLVPRWKEKLSAAVAGEKWIDFTLADKGTAVLQISDKFGIPPCDMVSFGDNFNDVPMFRAVPESYAVDSAVSDVRREAKHVCRSVEETVNSLIP